MYTNNWPTVDINLVLDVSSNKLGFPMMRKMIRDVNSSKKVPSVDKLNTNYNNSSEFP